MLIKVLLTFVFVLTVLTGQKEVKLRIHHFVGGVPYAQNQTHDNPDFSPLYFDRIEYYLSRVKLVHDGGQEKLLSNQWLLINADDDTVYSLGIHNMVQVEAIQFGLGVESSVNHNDPSLYAADHPLAHQMPSMHWGWTSGYRFLVLEGNAEGGFEIGIHALGDDLYDSTSVTLNSLTINDTLFIDVYADYIQAFNGIDYENGLISHGSLKPCESLALNFKNRVFSASQPSNVLNQAFNSYAIYPNPSSGTVYLDIKERYELEVFDLMGKKIPFTQNGNKIEMEQKGLFYIRIKILGQTDRIEAIIIE